ncbi:MAG: VWA domain-containing protein [Synergistaceae bacterium]|nr:VWA domain-containing protein [Synergistaceae bacterium]
MEMRRPVSLFTRLSWSLLLVGALAGAIWAEPNRLALEQVHREKEELVVVVDVRDGSDNALADLADEDVRATLGGEPLSLRSLGRFDTVGESAAYLFLVDVSKSLKKNQFDALREGLADWVRGLGDDDRFGLIAFGESVRVLAELGSDKKAFLDVLPTLTATDNWTNLNLALLRGLELGRRLDEDLPARRLIVVISDGIEDSLGGASKEEVLRRFREASIPVYALGYTPSPLTEKKKEGLAHLGEMARSSGGDIVVVEGAKDFPEGYRKLRSRIERTWVARFDASALSAEGSRRLQFLLQSGTKVLSDGTDLVPAPVVLPVDEKAKPSTAASPEPPASAEPSADGKSRWALPLIGMGLLLLGTVAMAGRKRKAAAPTESVPPPAKILTGGGWRLRLTVVRGAQPLRSYELDLSDPVIVGRSASRANLVIEGDLGISGAHLKIHEREKGLYVEDLGSTNGTFLNGVALSGPYRLKDSDLILLGGTELRVSLPEGL